MAGLTIAGVDDDLHYELKVRAHDAGLTLREFVLAILREKIAGKALLRGDAEDPALS